MSTISMKIAHDIVNKHLTEIDRLKKAYLNECNKNVKLKEEARELNDAVRSLEVDILVIENAKESVFEKEEECRTMTMLKQERSYFEKKMVQRDLELEDANAEIERLKAMLKHCEAERSYFEKKFVQRDLELEDANALIAELKNQNDEVSAFNLRLVMQAAGGKTIYEIIGEMEECDFISLTENLNDANAC